MELEKLGIVALLIVLIGLGVLIYQESVQKPIEMAKTGFCVVNEAWSPCK